MKELLQMKDISTSSSGDYCLRHLFLNVYEGQIVTVFGLHGSGKNLIGKVLVGEQHLQDGKIYMAGKEYTHFTAEDSRKAGIIYVDRKTQMIDNLPVYTNLGLSRDAREPHHYFSVYHRKRIMKKTEDMMKEYGLSLDLSMETWRLSDKDSIIYCLLKAIYSGAKLVVWDMSGYSVTVREEQQLQRLINQMRKKGTSFLLLCEAVSNLMMQADRIDLIHRGRITKSLEKDMFAAYNLEKLLLPYQFHETQMAKSDSEHLPIGILELFYSEDTSVEAYCKKYIHCIKDADEENTIFLTTNAMLSLCENLSIGENLALTCYKKISSRGFVSKSVLKFLEERFEELMTYCGVRRKETIEEMNYAEKKILGIEKWLLAGKKRLVLEDPWVGLDAEERQIMKKYLLYLASRDIPVIIILYNSSGIEEICSQIYLCERGHLIKTFAGAQ